MKVLYTLDSLGRGGTETLVLDVCRNAGKYGIELLMVATGGGDLEDEFETSGVPFLRLERRFPVDPGLVFRLRQVVKEYEIDIVHCHQPVEALHLYLATIGLDVKRILTHHGGGTRISTGKNKFAAKFLTPRMDANIACSKGMFPWLRSDVGLDTKENFFLVHNGVDPARLEISGEDFKHEIGLDDDDLLMGMVANFIPTGTKDQMTVCRALPEVFSRVENAYFVFVGHVSEGSEEYYERCVAFCDDKGIGEKVFFAGRRDDVPLILNTLDLFVFSTLNEGLPISLIEAMLAGVPVLATDIDAVLETTDNGKQIRTFPPRDAGELCKKMIELLSAAKTREKMAEGAKAYATANFSIGSHLRALKTLYSDISAKTGAPVRN